MRLPMLVICYLLLISTPCLAEDSDRPSFKQQILNYLQAMRSERSSDPGIHWPAKTKPQLKLHLPYYEGQMPLLLQEDGVPLGTSPLNYRMQLGSRQLGLEVRYEF
jgi:hypothetical protein